MEKNNSAKTLAIVFGVIAAVFSLVYIYLYSPSAEMEPFFKFGIPWYIELYQYDPEFYLETAVFGIFEIVLMLTGAILVIIIALSSKRKSYAINALPLVFPILAILINLIGSVIQNYDINLAYYAISFIKLAIPLIAFIICLSVAKNPKATLIVAAVLTVIALIMMLVGIDPFGYYREATTGKYGHDAYNAYYLSNFIYYVALWFGVASSAQALTSKASDTTSSATPNVSIAKAASPADISSISSAAEELKGYKELLDANAITQEEYDAKKKSLLGL